MKLHHINEAKYFHDAATIFNRLMRDEDNRAFYSHLLAVLDSGKRTFSYITDRFDYWASLYQKSFTDTEKEMILRVLQKNDRRKLS